MKSRIEKKEKKQSIQKIWDKVETNIKTNFTSTTSFSESFSYSEKKTLIDELNNLTEKLIDNKETEIAHKIIRCEFHVSKCFYQAGKQRLEKLQDIGMSMQRIAEQETSQFAAHYDFMDDILNEMHATSDVDFQLKCQLITRFSVSYGLCCIAAGTYKKAIEINEKAIYLIRFVFGKDYGHNKYLNRCYQNIGVAYRRLGNAKEEQNAYAKADEFKKEFDEWKLKTDREVPRREPEHVTRVRFDEDFPSQPEMYFNQESAAFVKYTTGAPKNLFAS